MPRLLLEILCWGAIGSIVYSYVLYPLLLGLTAWFKRRRSFATQTLSTQHLGQQQETPTDWPSLSLVIAAYCEETVILSRIYNALMMDYPADKLEILIGVDGQQDATGELVASVQDSRVKLLQYPQRRGKASVLNDTVPAAQGEIVLFSDANTFWDRDAARKLVRPFQKAQVGGVCGRLILTDAATGQNVDGIYWRYENRLKEWEGELGALLGANGAIYALRKELYRPVPPQTIIDDFLIGMRVHLQGFQFLYEKEAIAREETAPTIRDEFKRRCRIGAGGYQSLVWLWKLLLPTYGVVSWAFWSHKVLRWLCPAFMLTALITNGVLLAASPSLLYPMLMGLQILFYAFALCGRSIAERCFATDSRWRSLCRVPEMFFQMNLALACGFYRWAMGLQKGTWKRTDRSESEQKAPVKLSPLPVSQGSSLSQVHTETKSQTTRGSENVHSSEQISSGTEAPSREEQPVSR